MSESLTGPAGNTNAEHTLPLSTVDADATLAPSSAGTVSVDGRPPTGYVIEKELGRGGMGVVYLARDTRLNRRCALKMILAGAHSGSDEVERFKTEAQAIARLQHPGIVQVFEIGEHDGRPFMALEFCAGGSLDAVLAKNPLPPKEAAELVQALAEAMQAAHQANVIHRDLKPANVLLMSVFSASGPREGAVSSAAEMSNKGLTSPARVGPKITDFGLAKKLDESGATRTGSIMGTPSYMPPEQAQGNKDIGPAADIYALGAILYECLTGRPPFRAATALDTILQVLTDQPVPLRQLNAKVPQDLETIAHKCLQKDAKKRYATAQDPADDLGRFLGGEPIRARPVGVVERAVRWVRRNFLLAVAVALVMLTLTAGIIVSVGYARLAGAEAIAARKAEGAARHAESQALEQQKRAHEHLQRAEWSIYAGKLLLAQAAFSVHDVANVFRYLDECQPERRGWEHRYLRRQFDGSIQTHSPHRNPVTGVAFRPDSRRYAIGSGEMEKSGEVSIRDTETGTEILTLKGHFTPVTALGWSPDGKYLLTGGQDEFAKIWDVQTGRELHCLTGREAMTGVAWSPDGTRVLTGNWDGTVKVWETKKWTALLTIPVSESTFVKVAWSPDGQRILTTSQDRMAKVWDAANGAELLTLRPNRTGIVESVAWSPDGRRLLTASADRTAKVWVTGNESAPSWPLPDLAERKAYHTAQATLAEKEQKWFAVAFHVGRLLLDDPDNANLKKRREEASQKHDAMGR